MKVRFAVITKIIRPEGVLYDALMVRWKEYAVVDFDYMVWNNGNELTNQAQILGFVKRPIFHIGEVLVIDEHNIEITPPWRKPYRWAVKYEVYDNIEDAIKRSQQILNDTKKGGLKVES